MLRSYEAGRCKKWRDTAEKLGALPQGFCAVAVSSTSSPHTIRARKNEAEAATALSDLAHKQVRSKKAMNVRSAQASRRA